MVRIRSKSALLERARTARRESVTIDFKANFDRSDPGSWCEIIKDIIAMTNSGGGIIIVGSNDDGSPSSIDVTGLETIDPAEFSNKIHSYTQIPSDIVEIHSLDRFGHRVAALIVSASRTPIAFTKPGTYAVAMSDNSKSRQKTAFSQGTVYFRHGSKSEPGTTEDIRRCIDREVTRQREQWLGNIRRVTTAPADAVVQIYTSEHSSPHPALLTGPFLLTRDPSASGGIVLRPEQTHPHRTSDVVRILNERLTLQSAINNFDVQCIRYCHDIESFPEYLYLNPIYNTRQYSYSFIEWVIQSHQSDPYFFIAARASYKNAHTH